MYALKKILLTVVAFFLCTTLSFSQDKFRIIGGGKQQSMSFKLINNLIVIPVEVNGSEFNFFIRYRC